MNTISFQYEFRPELPTIYGAIDYQKFREMLIKIDEILIKSDLEHNLLSAALEQYITNNKIDPIEFYNSRKSTFYYKKFRHALRCNIARHLTGESYRLFSIRLADSSLFQWFTSISALGCRKAISKSSLERYEKYFDEEMVADKIRTWMSSLSGENEALKIGMNHPIDYTKHFMDSTCVKANIHFPVDWVLLRDAVRSLLLSIKLIRSQGLKHRMIDPTILMKRMNQLCIAMTHTRRQKESKKRQKKILRDMKRLSQCIQKHARRYRQILMEQREKTNWSEAQASQVINRVDNILGQLPAAIKQAHERIIGERKVPSKDKILSLYDKDAHVVIRGKAGNEVEFGQSLLLTEQPDGLIIDWKLFEDKSPSDSKIFEPAIKRLKKYYGNILSTCADRGFSSKRNEAILKENQIYNAICPKSPKQLKEKLTDPIFVSLQTRRSQTEARIGIFKNVFLGKPLRSRITAYKRIAINWCVLTHNLWVLSRKAITDEQSLLKKAA